MRSWRLHRCEQFIEAGPTSKSVRPASASHQNAESDDNGIPPNMSSLTRTQPTEITGNIVRRERVDLTKAKCLRALITSEYQPVNCCVSEVTQQAYAAISPAR